MEETGRHYIISFPEPIPRDETLYFIQDQGIAGLILFAEHCVDQAALKSWLSELKKSVAYPLIVAVDQEGGRVSRFTRQFPMLEAPHYYGTNNLIDQYRDDLERVCERLSDIGVNLNLVPTVDLFDTEIGHVLDTRTFSADPEAVIRFARATIDVHRRHRLCCCGKHFPGLGQSRGDPHHLPAISDRDEKMFFEVELKPFQAIIDYGVDSIMVTHLDIPLVDRRPAVASPKIIGSWLKAELAFAGPVITDDLHMAGASAVAEDNSLAGLVFDAGADLLLFGRNLDRTREMLSRFHDDWQEGRFGAERKKDALERVERLRRRLLDFG